MPLILCPAWAGTNAPSSNPPLRSEEWAHIKANYRDIREKTRNSEGGFPYSVVDRSALSVTDEERQTIYEGLWKDGGFKFLWGSFNDLLASKEANDTAADFIRSKIREVVKDPAVADRLTPKDHPYGTKRPPL